MQSLGTITKSRLIEKLEQLVTNVKEIRTLTTSKADFETGKAMVNKFGIRDYLIIVHKDSFCVYPLRSGVYVKINNEDIQSLYYMANHGEICKADPMMATRLLMATPTLTTRMTAENIINHVDNILQLQAWLSWHKTCELRTDQPENWCKWYQYFQQVDNPVMMKYLAIAINAWEQNTIEVAV